MAGEATIQLTGNLTEDPEHKAYETGTVRTVFRVANNPYTTNRQTGEYEQGTPLFLTCVAFGWIAHNVANNAKRGDRVRVEGHLRQRNYETAEGRKGSVIEVIVDEVGPAWSSPKAGAIWPRASQNAGNGQIGAGAPVGVSQTEGAS